jgi:hypothetical protein
MNNQLVTRDGVPFNTNGVMFDLKCNILGRLYLIKSVEMATKLLLLLLLSMVF